MSLAQQSSPVLAVYSTVGVDTLRVHIFSPNQKTSQNQQHGIVLFHGGGWVAGSPTWTYPAAQRFAELGLVAMAVEYRLSNDTLTPRHAFEDTCSFFGWLSQNANDLGLSGRIVGYGVSAGGHLVTAATSVGCHDEDSKQDNPQYLLPEALVLWSPALDVANDNWFVRLMHGAVPAQELSPVGNVGPHSVPTVVIIGEKDTLTPLKGAQKYCHELRDHGITCDIESYEGLGHLLTRNLSNQESNFDPDPAAAADGREKYISFLRRQGFLPAMKN